MYQEQVIADIMQLINDRQWAELRKNLSTWPPPEVADLIATLKEPQRVLLLRFLPRRFAADVFSELSPAVQDELVEDMTNHELRHLLANLDPDDRTALMDEMPAEITRKLLNLLSPQDLKETRILLGYPEDSVGRVMTPNIVYVKEDWTIERALDHIRRYGRDSETINVVYVTDSTGKLVDEIALRHLILASPDQEVRTVMDYNFIAISAMSDLEEAVDMIKKYNYLALPVVDTLGKLLGIVTIDDLMDAADIQATEDFQRIGGLSFEIDEDPIENLREAPVGLLYRRRIFWLVLLIFVNIFSGAGIAYFEDVIASTVVLVFFLPLLIAGGGNAGAQSALLMVRALATGDVQMSDWGRMLLKETFVGTTLGGAMGIAAAAVGMFRGGYQIAITVALSMFLIVLTGSLIGMCLPFILRKLGKDPATASAPLVTSVTDIVGVMIYFTTASSILG